MIKIYKSEFCSNCKITAQYLKSKGVVLEEVMITNDIAKDLADKGFTMLPVLEVDGVLMSKLTKKDLDDIIEREKDVN